MSGTRHFVVATAGHIDHGKSALVTALTGTNPDRLPEEKARGITIDLGFAALDVPAPSGERLQIGIVDVPGHEDFVTNMAAGVAAADLALLVVAADDGWMPQTEEHLQVLTYFGISHAVVALTKTDVAPEVERAAEAVRQHLRGTAFAHAPIVPTSVVTGAGVDALKATIGRVLEDSAPPRDVGKPRLPIDRVFTVAGAGTVVTGTLQGGVLHKGQQVVVQAAGTPTWIRRMQSHSRDVETAGPGMRVALNLPDLGPADVRRGDVVTLQSLGGPIVRLDVQVEISARAQKTLRSGTVVRVHYGSGHVGGRVALLGEDRLGPGGSAIAQLRLDRPVFVFEGDRFVIRDWAQQSTLAGGIVLGLAASSRSPRDPAHVQHLRRRAAAPAEAAVWVDSLLERDGVVDRSRVLVQSRFSQAEIDRALDGRVASGAAAAAGEMVCLARTWAALRQRAVAAIDAHHRTYPDRPGLPLTDLRALVSPLGSASDAFDALVAAVCDEGFVRDGNVVRRTLHRQALPPALEAAGAAIRTALTTKPFDPPSRSVLAPDASARRALRFLIEAGEAVELSADIVLGAEAVRRSKETIVALIADRGAATLSDVREKLGCSRRVLVPLLDYCDRIGLTVRHGDHRTLRR